MSDEMTERFPDDPSDEASESPEQRAARSAGLDALQFAALPSMQRYMLVFMTEIAARLERVEAKFDERSRLTESLGESIDALLGEVRVVKDIVDQVKNRLELVETRLGLVERAMKSVNRELLSIDERSSRRVGDLSDRVSHLEDQQTP